MFVLHFVSWDVSPAITILIVLLALPVTSPEIPKNPLLKEDGANLTPEGEAKLAEIAGEGLSDTTRMQENAETIYAQTEVEEQDVDERIAEAAAEHDAPAEGEVVVGEVAEDVGRRVEEAGMGYVRDDDAKEEDAEDAE